LICLPEEFVRSTIAREGELGAAWLAELPAIVDELLASWDCESDGEVMHGGVGIVVPVVRKSSEPAVLKVSFPHLGNRYEPDAFAAWGGRGAVLLHERDDERFAMLLERAHPTSWPGPEQATKWRRSLDGSAAALPSPHPRTFPDCTTRRTPGRSNYTSTLRRCPTR
jgi:streptomycin 6-kinase